MARQIVSCATLQASVVVLLVLHLQWDFIIGWLQIAHTHFTRMHLLGELGPVCSDCGARLTVCHMFKFCSPLCDILVECCCDLPNIVAFVTVLRLVKLLSVYHFNFVTVLPQKHVLLFYLHDCWNCDDWHLDTLPSFGHFCTWWMCNVWRT